MPTASPSYGTPTAMAITLASLASSTVDVGRESAAINQMDTTDAVDVIVGGKITTGTTPTTARQIEIWIAASYDDVEFTGGATGADAGLTATDVKTNMQLLCIIPTVATSNKTYHFGGMGIAQLFGGVLPPQWSVFVTHNTGVNLNSTAGNHEIVYTPVKYEAS